MYSFLSARVETFHVHLSHRCIQLDRILTGYYSRNITIGPRSWLSSFKHRKKNRHKGFFFLFEKALIEPDLKDTRGV